MEKDKFEKICFCCLAEEDHMKNMHDEPLATTSVKVQLIEGYKICTGFDELTEQESFDLKMICCACEQKLQASIEFRELCRTSYQTLKDKADFHPNLYVNVKHEVESDEDEDSTLTVKAESSLFTEVYIKNETSDTNPCTSSQSKSHKKKLSTLKKAAVKVPSDVDASDLESDYVCLRCDTVLPTHKEYKKHVVEQHKSGNGIPQIQKVCDICQVFTKRYTKHIFEEHKDYKPYKCKYCVKSFQSSGYLRTHIKSHEFHNALDHECLACHEKFGRNDMLRTHIKVHLTDASQYFCPFCGLPFDQFNQLNEHFLLLKHTSTKTLLPCYHCKRTFMVRKHFDDHDCPNKLKRKKLKTQNPVTCERCSGTFSTQDEFVCHQFLGCRDIQPPHCDTCNKIFSKKNDLQRHINRVHGQKIKPFICEICGHGSIDQTRYNIHKASHDTERNYECPHSGCKAAFKHRVHVTNHCSTVHKKMNSYECDVCKKTFRMYTLLKRHLLNHFDMSEYRKFTCEICGKRSTSTCRLLSHMISHTGEKSIKCKECPRTFSNASQRNQHHRLTHQGQYWQCKFCEVVCKSSVNFKQHLFVHRGFYPFNCSMCTAHYADKFLFKRHLRNQHKITYDENVHGYVEKENLDAVVKECERRNCTDLENQGT